MFRILFLPPTTFTAALYYSLTTNDTKLNSLNKISCSQSVLKQSMSTKLYNKPFLHLDHAWEVIQEHANDLLDSYKFTKDSSIPVKPAPEITPKPPMRRTISRRLSFTRSVSRDIYKRSMSRSSLHDGATPIIVPEDEDNIIPENDNMDEDVFHSLTIKEEKEVV